MSNELKSALDAIAAMPSSARALPAPASLPRLRAELDDLEVKVACNKISAMALYTRMRYLVTEANPLGEARTDSTSPALDPITADQCEQCGGVSVGLTGSTKWCPYCGARHEGATVQVPAVTAATQALDAAKVRTATQHVCDGCGTPGWTANCDQCIPY